MVVVGEILLSAFFQSLFDRLASTDFLNFVRQFQGGVDSDQLKKWEQKLKMIQAVLGDAEEKQLTDEAVKIWLDDLRDLAYDAEDILDEFATQALEHRLMAEDPDNQPTASRFRNIFPVACFNCFSPSTIGFNSSMRSKVKDITCRLEELWKQRFELGLQLTPGGASSAIAAQQRPPSSSVRTERAVYGRDEDKAKILDMVLSDDPIDSMFRVIPIVGMAGIGKTTLSREVYNDKAVSDIKFDIKAWVCVSDEFDVLSISMALLESITCKPCDLKALNEVQVQLQKALDGKKFLLVLDDVWNENYSLWEDLKAPFLAAAPNSKIIVTTRHSHVASTMGPVEHYNLSLLSDDDCWFVFMNHAFDTRDHIHVQRISGLFHKKVVQKCRGLPLAAKTLGGLLRTKHGDNAWEDILNSNIWDLPEQSGILPVLKLSYHYLPSHLKRCFAYCAIFPKDYELKEKELVFLWMAEGIIQQPRNNKQLEDWGSECFHDLVSRSIFQQSSGDGSKFVMHDLVHDLAQLVSGESICMLEEANKLSRRFERVRHSSYTRGHFDSKSRFESLYEVPHLRTFLPVFIRGGTDTSYITNVLLSDMLPKFKKLRVLSLEGYYVTQLPNSIKELKLLRYLNVAGTQIRSLPESTSSLMHLRVLILRDCSRLTRLPSKMWNLINLRHLDIEGANSLEGMPYGMEKLKHLQTLSNFIVGKDTGSGLKDLKNLKFLHGELCISGLQNVNDLREAGEAMLCEKQNLQALSLQWGSQFDSSREEVAKEHTVLDMLQPHTNLKQLAITSYSGENFPMWIGDLSFSKMEVLELENCQNCTSLPSLSMLGSLKQLTIKGMTRLKSIGSEFYGEDILNTFKTLETLRFENLPEWECWDTKENGLLAGFSSLRELSILKCPKFSGKLPELLPSLEILVISKCADLVVPFSSFPMLCRLEIEECKGITCSTPIDCKLIESMTISNSSLQIYGCKGMIFNDPPAMDSKSLPTSVTISNVLEFGKFLKQGFQQVETLRIGNSEQIKSWLQFDKPEQGLHVLSSPEDVSIEENCMSLVSFSEVIFLMNNLRYLKIENSRALKSLPQEVMGNNAQLEKLFIKYCDSLTFIAKSRLPSSLKRLEIENCKNLQHLVDGEEDASSSFSSSVTLKHLSIRCCPKLTTLSSTIQLLEALEDLNISDCPKLESIPDGLHNLKSLHSICISQCPSLVSFPERGLPHTISNVYIVKCKELMALPDDMNRLNSLQHLWIKDCPSIVSFPEEGFPINLTVLVIGEVKIYRALIQWGLHRLTSLRRLCIYRCDDAECFPYKETAIMLPASLTHLHLRKLSKLKYLSSMAFQSLASLKYLWLESCLNLTSFPKEGLPSSLLELRIEDCPMLKKGCIRDKGEEWSKIAHIPCVIVDWKFIYDQEEEGDLRAPRC
ncbi:putative disease resistance RPP13-like protein 1 [Citrus sinensis]|uniref:putative disease resistance RPP13-like protein 1 n=1 Tax=Citrus sinensis TaxID=2711 RepID=UPI002278561F|nr:putative disease resistance RPP13-like protein 1 [Citrus sinensis]